MLRPIGALLAVAFLLGAGPQLIHVADGSSPGVPGVAAQSGPASLIDAGGSHTCIITAADGVACWGANDQGQLGDGTTTYRRSPVMVMGLRAGVQAVTTGYAHTCALLKTGAAKCWGRNLYGVLGDGTGTGRTTPVDVVGLQSGVISLSAGLLHTCAVLSAGGVRCWGRNSSGELGDGTTSDSTVPVTVKDAPAARAVEAGGAATCLLSSLGGVFCWGANESGTLGDGTHVSRGAPRQVIGLSTGVAAISMAYRHVCALSASADLRCWGVAGWGQLGTRVDAANSPTPVTVTGVSGQVLSVSTGHSQTCVILKDHTARCWGLNADGEIGDGTAELRASPATVVQFDPANVQIAAGGTFNEFFTCARSITTIQCWGDNGFGQLGAPPGVAASTTPRQLQLPPAQIRLFAAPRVLTHRPFDSPVIAQVEDVLGVRSTAGAQPTITVQLNSGPSALNCPGGLTRVAVAGSAVFGACTVTEVGIYRVRAAAPALADAVTEFLALHVGAAAPVVARDDTASGTPSAPSPTPTATTPPFTPSPTATPTVTPSGKRTASLLLTLDHYEPVAVSGGWSNYEYTIRNTGSEDLDLAELTVQSWYSSDATLGGPDDCGAGGHVLGPGSIAPGDTIALSFGANLTPSPEYWPQCVDRATGFVIVEVHSRHSSRYLPGSWWVVYPVSRAP